MKGVVGAHRVVWLEIVCSVAGVVAIDTLRVHALGYMVDCCKAFVCSVSPKPG